MIEGKQRDKLGQEDRAFHGWMDINQNKAQQ
jgi:hypothetical protein